MRVVTVCFNNDSLELSEAFTADEKASFLAQIDSLGALSGTAQVLRAPITSVDKLASACASDPSTQTLLVLFDEEERAAVGLLKFGRKDLFFYTARGALVQRERCLCLLDFYVHENRQRRGLGKILFDAFLQSTQADPGRIAYDRPSPKLLPFLQRHFSLSGADLQPNRFTIFPDKFFA